MSTMSSMEDLLKNALAEIDGDVVPKHMKRTSEETTTFERLDKDKPTKKAKLDEAVDDIDKKENEEVKEKTKEQEGKPNHPEATELGNEQGNQDEEEEEHWHEPCHQPYDGWRPTYGYRRNTPYDRYGYNRGYRSDYNNRGYGRGGGCGGYNRFY